MIYTYIYLYLYLYPYLYPYPYIPFAHRKNISNPLANGLNVLNGLADL
jgi:hypothetical protein